MRDFNDGKIDSFPIEPEPENYTELKEGLSAFAPLCFEVKIKAAKLTANRLFGQEDLDVAVILKLGDDLEGAALEYLARELADRFFSRVINKAFYFSTMAPLSPGQRSPPLAG